MLWWRKKETKGPGNDTFQGLNGGSTLILRKKGEKSGNVIPLGTQSPFISYRCSSHFHTNFPFSQNISQRKTSRYDFLITNDNYYRQLLIALYNNKTFWRRDVAVKNWKSFISRALKSLLCEQKSRTLQIGSKFRGILGRGREEKINHEVAPSPPRHVSTASFR